MVREIKQKYLQMNQVLSPREILQKSKSSLLQFDDLSQFAKANSISLKQLPLKKKPKTHN